MDSANRAPALTIIRCARRSSPAGIQTVLARAILFLTAALLVMEEPSWGDEYHYQNILIGEKAAGMGGAAIGSADDGMACFHNPASLTRISEGSLSVSASLVDFKTVTYEKYFHGRDLTFASLDIVPSGWASVNNLWGGKVGVSIIAPDSYSSRVSETFQGQGITDSIQIKGEGRTYLLGATYAHMVTDWVSVGGTIFLSYRTADSRAYLSSSTASGTADTIVNSETTSVGYLVHLGLFFTPLEDLTIGCVYRSDSSVESTGLMQAISFTAPAGSRVFSKAGGVDLRQARSLMPWSVGIGISYRLPFPLTVATDVSYYHESAYYSLGQSVRKLPVYNWNVGMEYGFFNGKFPLRAGAYSNYTSAPRVNPATPEPQANHIDILGLTLSAGWRTGHTTTSVGIVSTAGEGETKAQGGKVYRAIWGGMALLIGGSYWF